LTLTLTLTHTITHTLTHSTYMHLHSGETCGADNRRGRGMVSSDVSAHTHAHTHTHIYAHKNKHTHTHTHILSQQAARAESCVCAVGQLKHVDPPGDLPTQCESIRIHSLFLFLSLSLSLSLSLPLSLTLSLSL